MEKGYYCPIASISPYQEFCGSDDYFCPEGSRAPLKVRVGYYTADYEYEQCEPGKYRQASQEWVDVSLPGLSDVTTSTSAQNRTGCELCPSGKFKSRVGDDAALCMDCPAQSESADNRQTCVCLEVVAAGTFKYFNITN